MLTLREWDTKRETCCLARFKGSGGFSRCRAISY